jgi:hypothetical protein
MEETQKLQRPWTGALLWAGVVVFAFYAFSFQRLVDPDLWGHLRFADVIIETRTVPMEDPYSYMPTKVPWINHEWLSGVVFAAAFRLGGDGALLLLKSILGSLIFLMMLRIALLRGAFPLAVVAVCSVAFNAILEEVYVRALLLSNFLFALFLWILEEHRAAASEEVAGKEPFLPLRKSLVFLLPVLTAFWTNCHGGVVVGLGTALIYLVTASPRSRTTLLAVVIASAASTLINPYGLAYWAHLYKSLSMARPYITEWRPIPLDMRFFAGYKVLLIVTVAALLASARRFIRSCAADRRAYAAAALVIFCTVVFSLKYYRNVPFLVLAASAFLPPLLSRMLDRHEALIKRDLFSLPASACLLAASIGLLATSLPFSRPWALVVPVDRAICSYTFPVEAVNFIESNNLKGRILCFFDWGEFLIFRLHGKNTVSFDPRLDTIYTDESIKLNLDFTYGDPGWKEILERFPPDLILANTRCTSYRLMCREKEWRALYADENCALFGRVRNVGDGPLRFKLPTRFETSAIRMSDAMKASSAEGP